MRPDCLALLGVLVLSASFALPVAAASRDAGKVLFSKGVVTAHVKGGAVRFLAPGAKVYEGEVVSTAVRSFAMLKMGDGTQMTIRPGTVLELERYRFKEKPNAVLRLFKGGLRAITGFISKRNPNAFRLRTSLATIGIRGTKFELRLCTVDCAAEASRIKKKPVVGSPVVARVVFLRGRATASRRAGELRKLSLGASLYEGDIVETLARSIAVVAFKDKSRATLQQKTRFKIERLHYEPAKPKADSMFLRLFKGGLRAVTGLIGKRNRKRVGFAAASATIGIRGTGLDMVCEGECGPAQAASAPGPAFLFDPVKRFLDALVRPAVAQGGRFFVLFWQNSGSMTSGGQTLELGQNEVGGVAAPGAPPQRFPSLPEILRQIQGVVRPDQPGSVDPGMREQIEKLFDAVRREQAPAGTDDNPVLLFLLDEGDADVDGIPVGEGEGILKGGDIQAPIRIVGPVLEVQHTLSPDLRIFTGPLSSLIPNLRIEMDALGGCMGAGL